MKCSSTQRSAKKITDLCKDITKLAAEASESEVPKNEKMTDNVQHLFDCLASTSLPVEEWKQHGLEADLTKVFEFLLQECESCFEEKSDVHHAYIQVCVVCVFEIASKLGKPDMTMVGHAVQDCLGLQHHLLRLKSESAESGTKDVLQEATDVQTQLLKSKKSTSGAKELRESLKLRIESIHAVGVCAVEDASKGLCADATTFLEERMVDLAPMAKGFREGASWLDGFDGNTFPEIQAHAAKTLLTLSAVDLVSKTTNLRGYCFKWSMPKRCDFRNALHTEALSAYKKVYTSLDVELDTVLVESVSDILRDARASKASACLLHHFASEANLEFLRTKVQAEIRDLRNHSLKETAVLPKLLCNRVQTALAMRKVGHPDGFLVYCIWVRMAAYTTP
eukprot:625247-Amphidinium_carterae.1